jgi:two-component system OmpR family response regulator
MEILLIEDDIQTQEHVASCLDAQGHAVTRAGTGNSGMEYALQHDYAAIIVDRMLPVMDGLSVVKTLRDKGSQTPILILTTMGGIDDRVEGLEAGADDYLVKPFAQSELIARVNALTRRASRLTTRILAGGLEMDLIGRTVTRHGKPVDLQPQEFRLLEYLMRNAGRVVTRAMLLEHVWDLHFDPRTNIVETHMSRLRAKIDRDFGTETIHTVRGAGYIIRAD